MQKLRNFIREHRILSVAIGAAMLLALIGCCVVTQFAGDGEEPAPAEVSTSTVEESEELAERTTVTATEGPTEPHEPTDTPEPIDTPELTDTPEPTPVPTNTTAPPTAEPTEPPEPTDTPGPTDTPEPTTVPSTTTPETAGPISPGTYLVGEDIQSGTYVGYAGEGFLSTCYWERLSSLSGELDAIIANDNSMGQFYVEVLPSDRAFSTDCEMFPIESVPAPEQLFTEIGPGTYIVGRDIGAGTWRGQADEGTTCYWERLACVQGTFNCIITNDNSTGQFFVEVAPSDFALSVACEMEKVE